MANGIVSTARGRALNIDELIMGATRKVGPEAKATRVTSHYKPNAANTPKVRGFMPTAGKALPPKIDVDTDQEYSEGVTVTKNDKVASSYNEDKEAKNLSDMTGIKLKVDPNSTRAQIRKAAAESKASGEGDEELGELLDQLEEAPAPKTRAKKK